MSSSTTLQECMIGESFDYDRICEKIRQALWKNKTRYTNPHHYVGDERI